MSTKIQNRLAHISNIINLNITEAPKKQPYTSPYRIVNQEYERTKLQEKLEEEIEKHRKELKELEHKLLKEQQLSFILKSYFQKIEKVIYNGSTNIFNHDPLDYQKLELYLRELIRRMQDINSHKLTAPPKIYKNTNIKTYRLEPNKQPTT